MSDPNHFEKSAELLVHEIQGSWRRSASWKLEFLVLSSLSEYTRRLWDWVLIWFSSLLDDFFFDVDFSLFHERGKAVSHAAYTQMWFKAMIVRVGVTVFSVGVTCAVPETYRIAAPFAVSALLLASWVVKTSAKTPNSPPSIPSSWYRQCNMQIGWDYHGKDVEVPEGLCCPITQELFIDPVALVDRIYERREVEAWVARTGETPFRAKASRRSIRPHGKMRELVWAFAFSRGVSPVYAV
uniref:U-box domain-containing protein n=1 Tax=Chromera velia CCMP2878 TaxID=1169474 RepID=A0A0G4F037_9ALVE|eukprot:Cvel_14453.t1-p1 / transcript=Cvel_14453.t1 / gene=Cvel_14453 / organism=Chromera_velia_CCMP2878 / gene_product=hypothetical protein / transcript_product=hypothetical protein / location=Cvel_scaffold1029:12731-13447(+) / protein_length=239 / sequence_SO=supercontig / SO=protein_coding / is_pseudo=false